MLSIKKRQEYLKYLGFYNDKIDGIVGKNTKSAYKKLQDKYFTRKSDRDGIYGINTERLLMCAYNVKKYCKDFELWEFRCECGGRYCTGYPAILKVNLLKNMQSVRNKNGSTQITSGLRCTRYNASIGGIKGSEHTKGGGADFYVSKCKTSSGRKEVVNYFIKLSKSRYSYCNGYARSKIGVIYRTSYPKAPGMGNAVHGNV